MNSEVGSLKDPDKGRPVHMRKKICIIPMLRRESDDSKIVLKHNSLRKPHVHNCIFAMLGELNA